MVYRNTAGMSSPTQTPRRDLPIELREVSVVRLTDPTAVGDTIELLDQDVVNLDPEGFEVKRVTVPLEECCLVYQWSSTTVRSRTVVHSDFDACSILGPHVRGSIDGTELSSYALIAAGPGAEAELIIDSNFESVVWLVPPQVRPRS